MSFLAGAAMRDITPPPGLRMEGFAARVAPAVGTHDPLRATALVVGDTAILSLDLLAAEATLTAEITARVAPLGLTLVVAATHTHGGPACRGAKMDVAYRTSLIDLACDAVAEAHTNRQPALLRMGHGRAPNVAKNRRHAGGPTDQRLPVIAADSTDGKPIATLVAYACHPTVLGADNRLWTADWHGPLRARLEAARPGAVALTLTGCTGDANVGHSAASSITLASSDARSFAAAETAGVKIADAALAATLAGIDGAVAGATATARLNFQRREPAPNPVLGALWSRQAETETDPARKALLEIWVDWAAANPDPDPEQTLDVPVAVLKWGPAEILCLPGEMFSAATPRLREAVGNPNALVIAYAGDNPGYIPVREEYAFGGYEVDEAHRFYGQPASFAPGSAELIAAAAAELLEQLRSESEP